MKKIVCFVTIIALLVSASFVHQQFEKMERADPLGKELLYLPSSAGLELLSLGNKGLVADVLFLWAIQYFAQFEPNSQFLYLDQVFDLITDLDPRYRDAYHIGALIMFIEAEGDPAVRKESVLALLDKGIKMVPDDYYIPLEAAWRCHFDFKDHQKAAEYAKIAAERPNADAWAKRMYGYLAVQTNVMTTDQAIEHWQGVLESAGSDFQISKARSALYDLLSKKDKTVLQKYLDKYFQIEGKCPESWEQIIEAKITVDWKRLNDIPKDPYNNEYLIDTENCKVVAFKKIKEE